MRPADGRAHRGPFNLSKPVLLNFNDPLPATLTDGRRLIQRIETLTLDLTGSQTSPDAPPIVLLIRLLGTVWGPIDRAGRAQDPVLRVSDQRAVASGLTGGETQLRILELSPAGTREQPIPTADYPKLADEAVAWLIAQAKADKAAGTTRTYLLGVHAPQEVSLGIGLYAGTQAELLPRFMWPLIFPPPESGAVATAVIPRLRLGSGPLPN